MKKLIFILFGFLFFTSCVEIYTDEKKTEKIQIPYEISQKLLTDTATVELFVYKTDDYHYYFNEKKELIGRHYVTNDEYVSMALPILLLMLIFLLIIGLISK